MRLSIFKLDVLESYATATTGKRDGGMLKTNSYKIRREWCVLWLGSFLPSFNPPPSLPLPLTTFLSFDNGSTFKRIAALKWRYHYWKCTSFDWRQVNIENRIRPWVTVSRQRNIWLELRRWLSWWGPHSMARCLRRSSLIFFHPDPFYEFFCIFSRSP